MAISKLEKNIAETTGNCLKMPDGTLIASGRSQVAANTSYVRCAFDEPFIDTSYYVVATVVGTPISAVSIGTKTTNFVDINSVQSSYNRSLDWIAIGKWK